MLDPVGGAGAAGTRRIGRRGPRRPRRRRSRAWPRPSRPPRRAATRSARAAGSCTGPPACGASAYGLRSHAVRVVRAPSAFSFTWGSPTRPRTASGRSAAISAGVGTRVVGPARDPDEPRAAARRRAASRPVASASPQAASSAATPHGGADVRVRDAGDAVGGQAACRAGEGGDALRERSAAGIAAAIRSQASGPRRTPVGSPSASRSISSRPGTDSVVRSMPAIARARLFAATAWPETWARRTGRSGTARSRSSRVGSSGRSQPVGS